MASRPPVLRPNRRERTMSSTSTIPPPVILALTATTLFLAFGMPASAGNASIAWRVEVDGRIEAPVAVGPDGEIAVQGFELVVIEPDGTVRWRQDLPVPSSDRMCAIDGQGRIYASTMNDLRAYAADGSLLWTALDNPAGFEPFAGPTVGPDGNVYVLDVEPQASGGRGFVSVTPGGDVRWSHEHENWALAQMGEARRRDIGFADGLALVSSPGIPCEGGCLGSGVMAFTLDGDVVWSTETASPHWVTPGPAGKAYLARDPIAYDVLDTDDGAVTPVALSPQPLLTAKRVAVAPDGTGYVGTTPSSAGIRRLDPSGDSTVLAGDIGVPGAPAISPDGSVLVVPTAESILPSLNSLTGLDPESGDVLWSVPLPPEDDGDYPIVTGMPRFSADGHRVFLSAATFDRSWVYAFALQTTVGVGDEILGDLTGLDLRVLPGGSGTRFRFDLPAAAPVTLEIYDLRGRQVAEVIGRTSMSAGEHSRTWDAGQLASGMYLVRLQAGQRSATAKLTLVR
ncbi:PQQ-binding-like beta-propeller repeat protein [bacterium]|nr:PQQ-binding-like beta-propeller repeat protein [bacterium]